MQDISKWLKLQMSRNQSNSSILELLKVSAFTFHKPTYAKSNSKLHFTPLKKFISANETPGDSENYDNNVQDDMNPLLEVGQVFQC